MKTGKTGKTGKTSKTRWTGKSMLRAVGGCAIGAMAIVAVGCDNNHLLGAVDGGPGPSQDTGPPPTTDASPDLSQPVGGTQTWTGYVENYAFPSGSDALKIAFSTDATGQVTGTVILGNGTPPPPATDPNVGYPPGFAAPGLTFAPLNYVAEGYAYTMRGGTLAGQRLRFGVSLTELWRGWCALQTPIPGAFSCVPNWGGTFTSTGCSQTDPATNQMVAVDCGKLSLCFAGMVCQCDASGCQAEDMNRTMFDISIANDRADGSMDTHNVHFMRDP